jgi:hypothetical protein
MRPAFYHFAFGFACQGDKTAQKMAISKKIAFACFNFVYLL